jgi:LPXTG-motif cell wall-anchored protein
MISPETQPELSAAALPETGADVETSVLVGGALLIAGAGLLAAGRLRRRA